MRLRISVSRLTITTIYAICFLGVLGSDPCIAKSSGTQKTLVLTGYDLSLEDVVRVAREQMLVQADARAIERIARSHQLLLLAAKRNLPIYGLNRGVGLNKDREIFKQGEIDPEVREISERFNRDLLHSHSAGVPPKAPEKAVRAAMLVRLNTMLFGKTGVQPEVVRMYVKFLNLGIHPILPARGSVGEGDITILPHIGLAMMGEGEVVFRGSRMKASKALEKAGLPALVPFAKDGLSILSSNAYSAGIGVLLVHDAERLLDMAEVISALSLEGLNGNVAPLLAPVQEIRPYQGQAESAERMRGYLAGSYLWEPDEGRALQDPLSFRTSSQVHGVTRDALESLKRELLIQLNSSDDNPAVIPDITPSADDSELVKAYYVREGELFGAVIPSANFEPISWVLGSQALGNALKHVSSSVQRMTRLDSENITKLNRFLSPGGTTIAFGTIQKAYMALDAEIRALINPVSADSYPVAGDIEDHASNAPIVVQRVSRIVDNLYYIFGMELMHAAQAVDLRRMLRSPDLKLGHATEDLYARYRAEVPFLAEDRTLTIDIRTSYEFTKYGASQAAGVAGSD
jgi:histidine ammonia-lyase